MNGAFYESGNIFFKLKYAKTYDGVLATPMTVRDIAVGELIYTLMRGAVYAVGFVAVMLALGLVDSPWALLAVPGAVLVSAAFAAPAVDCGDAHAVMGGLRLRRALHAADVPLLGDVRPARRVPPAAQWIVPLTPLYHGVHMLRSFTLGAVGWTVLLDIAYLVAMTGIFLVLADRRLARLLLK